MRVENLHALDQRMSQSWYLVVDIQYFVWMDIYDLRSSEIYFRGCQVAAVEVCVSMKMISRFCNSYEPVQGFQPRVSLGVVIMHAKGW